MSTQVRWLSAAQQRAWRAYRRMVLLLDGAVARELQHDTTLSVADYQVLMTLSESAAHRLRLTELALTMQWSASRLSHHVTRMEQRGLVGRADCSEDLRAAYVELTDVGWDAVVAAAPHHVASVRAHLIDLLDDDDIAALTRIAEKVAGHFGESCVDHLPARTVDRREVRAARPPCGQPGPAGQSSNEAAVSRS